MANLIEEHSSMAIQFFPELSADTQDNHVNGTDQDDSIIVMGDIHAFEGYTNRIDTGTGNDSVIVSGSMISEAPYDSTGNFILAEEALLVNISQDMVSRNGANEITAQGAFGADSVVTIGGAMRADAEGHNWITLQEGNILINIGAAHATDGGRNEINFSGDGPTDLTVYGDVTSSEGGSNIFIANGDNPTTTIKGDVLALSGGINEISSWGENGSHTKIHGDVIANNAFNTLNSSSQNDSSLIIGGKLQSLSGAETQVYVEGDKYHLLSIAQGIHTDNAATIVRVADHSGYGFNELNLGDITSINDSFLDISILEAATNIVNINGDFTSISSEVRLEAYGLQDNIVTITGELGVEGGQNTFEINGAEYTNLTIGGGVSASNGANLINLGGNGLGELDILGGLQADNAGSNAITVTGQPAALSISGDIFAEAGSTNELNTSSFNDSISLNGSVSTGGLQINAGEGYDVLTLNALTHNQFGNHYRDWLNDLQANDAINDMGLEAIRVDMGWVTQSGLNSLDWLDDIVTTHNAAYDDQLALELNVDGSGRNLSLDDFFSSSTSDKFSGLDMSGTASNNLTISGSFADNGLDGDFLRILGDNQDSVALSEDWVLSQSNFVDVTGLAYDVYTNSTDELLIQSNISIV